MKKTILLSLAATALIAAAASTQKRTAIVHMKSGEAVEYEYNDIDSITFSEPVAYDLDMEAAYASAIYYGDGAYILHISDKPISTEGLPTEVGQKLLRVYPISKAPADSRTNCNIAEGRYVANKTFDEFTLYAQDKYFCLMVCTGIGSDGSLDGYSVPLDYGTLNVGYTAGGSTLTFRGGFDETYPEIDNIKNLKMTYSGPLEIDNQDPSVYDMLEEDINVVPTRMTGRYSVPSSGTAYGNFSLALFNTPVDNEGFIAGGGDLISIELLTEYAVPMDISKMAGEYTIASVWEGPYTAGRFLSGTMYEDFGIPMGTYYAKYEDSGYASRYGFATGGTLKITVDGTNVTLIGDIETENGKRFTFNYTSPTNEIQDYTSSSSAGKPGLEMKTVETSAGKLTVAAPAVRKAPCLRFVKK